MNKLKKIKAVPFDKMQYLYGTVHEPLIHCLIELKGCIDDKILERAVKVSIEAIPLLDSCFVETKFKPYWIKKNFTSKDFVKVIKSEENVECLIQKLLGYTIDISHEPQIKIYIVRELNKDSLCIIINHMICDGAGFKHYLYMLCNIYNSLKGNPDNFPQLEFNQRSAKQLFSGLSLYQKLKILFSKHDLSKQKVKYNISFEGDNKNPLFITTEISNEEIARLKLYAKNHDATLNDIILTAYARVLNKETGNEEIILPCPVDLRKYVRDNTKTGICNLTSNFICDVIINKNELFAETLNKVSSQMKIQKSDDSCLKSIITLEFAFTILPFFIVKKLFFKVFTIPVVSYTNLGIIDNRSLSFDGIETADAYMTGAVKYNPYFQIAVSTYNGKCTLSCNMYGTDNDKKRMEQLLSDVKKELIEINQI
ncbi:MAG: condensation domain-containing protein [Bacillota bacterium]|nr:condensation domain-containing protein [Bacillota bacterium]